MWCSLRYFKNSNGAFQTKPVLSVELASKHEHKRLRLSLRCSEQACLQAAKLYWLPGLLNITPTHSGDAEQQAHVPVHVLLGHMAEITQLHAPGCNDVRWAVCTYICLRLRCKIAHVSHSPDSSYLYRQLSQLLLFQWFSFHFFTDGSKCIYWIRIMPQAPCQALWEWSRHAHFLRGTYSAKGRETLTRHICPYNLQYHNTATVKDWRSPFGLWFQRLKCQGEK